MMLAVLIIHLLSSISGSGSAPFQRTRPPAKAIAYVRTDGSDIHAILGDCNSPFATIAAAILKIPQDGGVIMIGPGLFDAPNAAILRSHLVFKGSGKPVPDWKLSYTATGTELLFSSPERLIGGTVLRGTMNCSLLDDIVIQDLGVDVGYSWCKVFNMGQAAEGLIFAQKYNLQGGLSSNDKIHELQVLSPQRYGIVVQNVSVLCRDSKAPVHAMLFENLYCPQISNVSTYYGLHGVVLKCTGGQISNMDAHGHFGNGLIIKSNDYAFSGAVSVSNVYITSIEKGDGGGIRLVGENDTLRNINISNFVTDGTHFGVSANGKVAGVALSNGQILLCSGIAIDTGERRPDIIWINIIERTTRGLTRIISGNGVTL